MESLSHVHPLSIHQQLIDILIYLDELLQKFYKLYKIYDSLKKQYNDTEEILITRKYTVKRWTRGAFFGKVSYGWYDVVENISQNEFDTLLDLSDSLSKQRVNNGRELKRTLLEMLIINDKIHSLLEWDKLTDLCQLTKIIEQCQHAFVFSTEVRTGHLVDIVLGESILGLKKRIEPVFQTIINFIRELTNLEQQYHSECQRDIIESQHEEACFVEMGATSDDFSCREKSPRCNWLQYDKKNSKKCELYNAKYNKHVSNVIPEICHSLEVIPSKSSIKDDKSEQRKRLHHDKQLISNDDSSPSDKKWKSNKSKSREMKKRDTRQSIAFERDSKYN